MIANKGTNLLPIFGNLMQHVHINQRSARA